MSDKAEIAQSFLSHNSRDKPAVEVIQGLLERGDLQRGERPIPCWFDKDDLRSQGTWMSQLEDAVAKCGAAVVFYGPDGHGPVHKYEIELLLKRAMYEQGRDAIRLVLVLLPGAQESSIQGFISLHMWADFRKGLDDAAALQRLRAFILGEAPKSGPGDDPKGPKPEIEPYRGLEPFEGKHAIYFFGRDNEIKELCGRLQEWPFTAVIGGSGSGKSSIVRAGLQTELATRQRRALAHTTTITVRPGSSPIRALADQVVASLREPSATVTERLKLVEDFDQQFRTGSDKLLNVLSSLYPRDDQHILLVIDQFEELFTHSSDNRPAEPSPPGSPTSDSQQAQFVELLAAVAKSQLDRLRIVITLRADFFDRCLSLPTLKSLIENRTLLLGKLSDDALRTVIEAPAFEVRAYFEKGLVARILKDVENQNGSLPLLQHALKELWEQRRFGFLTDDAYDETGGVEGALKKRANATLQNLNTDHREIAKNIFLRLTTLGEGVSDTRRRVRKTELYPEKADPRVIDVVLKDLSSQTNRLIVANDDGTVEVTHEALIQRWDTLKGWLAENRDDKRLHDRLRDAANEWADPQHGRDSSYLWEGGRLDLAEKFDQSHPNMLTALERVFLGASIAKREQAKRQKEEAEQEKQRMRLEEEQRKEQELKRAKRLSVVAILVAVAMGTLLIWGYRAQSEANRKSTEVTAVALMAGLPGSQIPTENEYISLTLLADASPAVRVAFMEHLLASPEKAERLRALFPYILHAVVGLNVQERNRLQLLLLKHGQESATLPPAINIACAELGALLAVDDPNVHLMVATNFVAAMKKTTDPKRMCALGRALGNLGEHLSAEHAAAGAEQIAAAMKRSNPWNWSDLSELASALASLGENLPSEQAEDVARQIMQAMGRSNDGSSLHELGEALARLGESQSPQKSAELADRLTATMEKPNNPYWESSLEGALAIWREREPAKRIVADMRNETDTSQLSRLSTELAGLSNHLPTEQAAAGARRIVDMMTTTPAPNYMELSELGSALGCLGEHLPAEQAAAGASQLVAAMKNAGNPDELSALSCSLASLGGRLPTKEAIAGTERILAAMKDIPITNSRDLSELGSALNKLARRLSNEQAVVFATRVVTAMENATYQNKLALSDALGCLGEHLPVEQAAAGASQLVAAMKNAGNPDELSALSSALASLGERLPAEEATAATQRIVEVMTKTPATNYMELSELGSALGCLGEHLPAEQAAAGASQLVAAMKNAGNPDELSALSCALASLGERLPAEEATAATQRIVEVMTKTPATNYMELSELGSALGCLGEHLPVEQAAAGASQLVAAMKNAGNPDELSALSSALASLGERLPAEEATAATQRIVEVMTKTPATNYMELSQLGHVLGHLRKFLPDEQAVAGAKQIVAAMGRATGPDAMMLSGISFGGNMGGRGPATESTKASKVAVLASALVSLEERLPDEQAVDGAQEIMAAILSVHGTDNLSELGGVLRSLSKHVPVERAVAMVQQVLVTMEKTTTQDQLSTFGSVLSELFGILNIQQTSSVLKSLVCVGECQQAVLNGLEKKTSHKFDGNVWKAVQWAELQGIDVKKVPRWPLRTME